jgi:hypothetical protein
MKSLKLVLVMMVCFVWSVNAQNERIPKEKKERMEAMKVGFITKKLELTSEEAQVFWPVYNELNEKRHALKKESRENHKALNEKGDKASDKDFEDVFNTDIDLKEKGIALEKEYFAKMKAVIPVSKIAKLHQAEREFKRHMLKSLKEGRPNHHQMMQEKKAE